LGRTSNPIHERVDGRVDLPLSSVSKRVLSYAAEESDCLCSKHIGTEHLLFGLLREENCFAAEFLHEHCVRLASTREELMRIPHNYSATEQFVRERGTLPEDVVELQTRIGIILGRVEHAVARHDFVKAREYSEEEGREREKLRLLYQQRGLPDWLYD
jgi:ATP-dependent Clp protease ATP-binding subunit ClpA